MDTNINKGSNVVDEHDTIDLSIAIDFSASPLVFVDNNFCIRYVNFKALQFFKTYEDELKKDFEYFNPHDLLGKFFAYAHNHVSHHIDSINKLNIGEHFSSYFPISGHLFELKFTPILNTKGSRSGTCLEFIDYEPILKSRTLLSEVLSSANQGDFSNRINRDDMKEHLAFQGVFHDVNQLFSTINNFFGEVAYVLDRISSGDLTQTFTISNEEGDDFSGFKRDTNYAIDKLKGLFTNIKNVSEQVNETIIEVSKSYTDIDNTVDAYHRDMNKVQFSLGGFFHDVKENHQQIQKLNELIIQFNPLFEMLKAPQKSSNNISQELSSIFNILDITENFFKTYLTMLQKGLDSAKTGNASLGFNLISEANQSLNNKAFTAINQLRDFVHKAVKSAEEPQEIKPSDHLKQVSEYLAQIKILSGKILNDYPDESSIEEQIQMMLEAISQSKSKTTTVISQASETLECLKEASEKLSESIRQFKFTADIDSEKLNREINF